MIKILSEGLLCTQSLLLARLQTAPLILNEQSESEKELKNNLSELVDWCPRNKFEQKLL